MRMERKLRAVVLLQMHLLCVSAFFADGQSSANHENVIDLVEALNIPHRKNVTSGMIYKLRPRAPHLTLPAEYSHSLYSNLQGSIGVHVVARQAPRSTGTVFSLSSASASLPILQIISSTLDNTLRLDYQAEGRPHSFASFHFPGTNPFSSETWVWLAVSLEPDRLAFFVDCQEAAVLPIENENKINLELPQDVLITLGSTLGKRDSKFSGYLKTAELSLKAYPRRPWICNNLTDEVAPSDTHNPDSWTESSHPHSKLQAKHRSQEQTSHHPPDIQSDQMQRAAVVEPRGSPQGVTSASQVERDDRLRKLERRMTELTHILDRVNNKNEELQNRVSFLELCLKEQCQGTQSDYPVHNASNSMEDCCSQASSCNPCPSQACPSQPCPSQPCPSKPCPSQPCPSQPCPSQPCPSKPCPSQPCPPQPCPPQPCPTQVCKEENVPDCERRTCVEVNRECPQQPCPPQTYPIQHCKEENVPDCQRPACNPCPPQPCPPQPCPPQACAPQACPPQACPPQACPPQACPLQACPTQNCKEENVPDCQRRTCEGGNRECPTCSEENVPEGCEQRTTSCGVNGHDFPNGAVIPVGDPCQECRCVDGNMVCSPLRCPALSCRNPVHHAGECCPRCEQCQFESKVYVNGETFTSRRHPCLQCHCSAGEVSCEHMGASCPTPHCSHPAKHRGQCCPTCSDCQYERRVYTDGTTFTPAGSGLCLHCRCKGGNVLCNEEKCPPVHCSNPVRDPDRCCPVCKNQ